LNPRGPQFIYYPVLIKFSKKYFCRTTLSQLTKMKETLSYFINYNFLSLTFSLIFLFLFALSFLSNFPVSLFFDCLSFYLFCLFSMSSLPRWSVMFSLSTITSVLLYLSINNVFQKLFVETLNNLAKNCFKTLGGKTTYTNLKVFVIIFILCMLRFLY